MIDLLICIEGLACVICAAAIAVNIRSNIQRRREEEEDNPAWLVQND